MAFITSTKPCRTSKFLCWEVIVSFLVNRNEGMKAEAEDRLEGKEEESTLTLNECSVKIGV